MSTLDSIPTDDVNVLLHELRMRRLALMPADGGVVLSGGAANQMYFQWFDEHYPGKIERHIAVELFSPAPDPLPEGVQWLARSVGDLSPVGDGEVDLVFAGQVIEHLWPGDMAGFICESHRVLGPGGAVVIDSPTRFITRALGWTQPEHTIELEVDEIVELLGIAGFVDIDVKGIWLCYDRARAQTIPIDAYGGGSDWPWQRRVSEAERRPRDSFIWWAEARKGDGPSDRAAVNARVGDIYARARPTYFERMRSEIGQVAGDSLGRRFRAPQGQPGLLLRGPSIALPPGRHEAVFRLRADAMEHRPSAGERTAEVEVTRDDGRAVADWALTASDLPPGGATREVVLPFELRDTAFNGELRVRSMGTAPLIAEVPVAVRENVAGNSGPRARALGQDVPRVYARANLRRIRRVVGWPARRLLDPRLEGLRNHTQWVASSIAERIDARTSELRTRIDELAEQVHPAATGATQRDRSVVLPYVLSAVGKLEPGASILVAGPDHGAICTVLRSLGYDVVAIASDSSFRVSAAVIWSESTDHGSIEEVVRAVHPSGVLVLIADVFDQAELEALPEGSVVEDKTVSQGHGDTDSSLTLMRVSLPALSA